MNLSKLVCTIGSLLFLTTVTASAADVRAYLYNPAEDKVLLKYPYQREAETVEYHPFLVIAGADVPEGEYRLGYSIEREGQVLFSGSSPVKTIGRLIMSEIRLEKRYPEAQAVRWELKGAGPTTLSGTAPLKWSRFHGTVKYRDPGIRQSAYIELNTIGFGAPGKIHIPVADNGTFDTLIPARIYKVLNVNSTGYQYNAMERWGWDYDLTRDREDEFVIGRTEIYGMNAFRLTGGPSTILVAFRPTALSRVLGFDADKNGRLNDQESAKMSEALKKSFTAIGPELKAENIKAWIDGKPYQVVQLTQTPEFNGDGRYQVLYLVQLFLDRPLMPQASHEIKIEVESEEHLNGEKVIDWGQGSVGYCWTIF
jgi:hypothetical protein